MCGGEWRWMEVQGGECGGVEVCLWRCGGWVEVSMKVGRGGHGGLGRWVDGVEVWGGGQKNT